MSRDRLPLEDYQGLNAQLEAIDGQRLTIFVRDDIPEPGEALALGAGQELIIARCAQALGGRRVAADLLGPPPAWLAPGAPMTRLHKEATLGPVSMEPPVVELASRGFGTHGPSLRWQTPGWMALDLARQALHTGLDALDVMCPLVEGGVNLVVDASPNARSMMSLALRAHQGISACAQVILLGPARFARWPQELGPSKALLTPEAGAARHYTMRAALSWLASVQDGPLLVLLELPALGQAQSLTAPRQGHELSVAQLIDALGESLASTHQRRVTALARLALDPTLHDLPHILDSLSLGDVDSQLVIQRDGALSLVHSRSRLERSPQDPLEQARQRAQRAIQRASPLRERAAIFGLDELDEEQLAALEEASPYLNAIEL